MKQRTGKECKQIHCVNYIAYVNWAKNLGNSALGTCMNCKYSHVSQFRRDKHGWFK